MEYIPIHPHKDGNPLTNRTPTDKEQQLGWEYTKRLLDLHIELGGVEPLVLAVGQKSADTMGKIWIVCHWVAPPCKRWC